MVGMGPVRGSSAPLLLSHGGHRPASPAGAPIIWSGCPSERRNMYNSWFLLAVQEGGSANADATYVSKARHA
eukprot:4189635-Amphidinium_carterae.1